MKHKVPAEALRMFDEGKTNAEVLDSGVLNFNGDPPRPRTVRDWRAFWTKGNYIPFIRVDDEVVEVVDEIAEYNKPPIFVENGNGATAKLESRMVKSVEELEEVLNIDTQVWKRVKCEISTWPVPRKIVSKELEFVDGKLSGSVEDYGERMVDTMFSIKASYVRREEAPYEEFLEKLPVLVGGFTPRKTIAAPLRITGDHVAVVHIYDAHFNKRPFNKEYTIQDALEEYKKVVVALCGRMQAIGVEIEEIVFPLGHDFLHTDTLSGTTTSGTQQDIMVDPCDAIYVGAQAAVFAVDEFSKIAPTQVVSIRGNHDSLNSIWLGLFIKSWFRNTENVFVDASKEIRKYLQYGTNCFGFTHGDRVNTQRLAMLMPAEVPQMWADTEYRIMFLGNLHTKQGMFYQVWEEKGVVLKVIPAICHNDYWHTLMGFVGNKRAAEVDLYHKQHGPAGSITVFVDEL